MIVERIDAFVRGESDESFDALALASFACQYERIGAYRALCRRRQVTPETVGDWRRVPPVPALAFKSLELAVAEPVETFRSSGTTGSSASVHHHPYPDLYRTVIDHSFPAACLEGLRRPPVLSLIPSREQLPESSLGFMADHILDAWAAADSLITFGPRGVEVARARSFLAARQRDRRPTLILATALALAQLLEALDRRGLRFRLPPGSRVFETGGTKGRRRALEPGELVARIADGLALPPESVVREYGMTELTSQFYAGHGRDGEPLPFRPQPWTRVRILDPETLDEAPAGSVGLIAVFDLANVGSAVHLLTEDLGIAEGGGFQLTGRAAGAELRGCSLTAEELAASAAGEKG